MARGQALDSRRMDCEQSMKRIGLADVSHDIAPFLGLLPVVVRKTLHLVPGQIGFACRGPNHWQRTPTRNEIAPMLFHFLDAHAREVMSPGAENARREPLLDEKLDAPVGQVEVL